MNRKLGFFGGVEQTVHDTALGLRARGWHCELAHGERARDPSAYAEAFHACHPCTELEAPSPHARPAAEIVAAAPPDVVFMHKVAPELVRNWGVPTTRYVHDHDLYCPRKHKYWLWTGRICHQAAGLACWADLAFLDRGGKGPLGLSWRSLLEHRAAMRRNFELDGLYAGSAAMAEMLVTNGCPADRVRIVPPVMEVDLRQPPLPLPSDPKLLFVGQLIRGKGVDLLLHALTAVKGEWTARIIGDGNGRAGLEELSEKLGLGRRVHFDGWLPHEALTEAYDAARVVAVPSRWPEPFGMVGPEAMSRGRPVVAFAVGGIPDWCRHEETGLLAPEGDVETLSRHLERLLHGEEAELMGRAARKRVEEVFAFDRLLDRLVEALNASIAGSHRRA